MIYHADPKKPDDEELGFNTIAGYNAFLQENGLLQEGAPRIIITGMMGEPADLSGNWRKRVMSFIRYGI